MPRELRPYQQAAVDAVYREWQDGTNRTVIVLPTGTGKTDCLAKIATDEVRAGGRVLVLAHRAELLGQITERIGMHDPAVTVGRVQGARKETRRQVTCAMVQTAQNDSARRRMVRPTLVIIDEAHHGPAAGYRRVLDWAGCYDEDNPTRLMGVTATLNRSDKLSLGDVWSSVAFARDIAWAVEQGWLVPPRGRCVVADHVDLAAAKVRAGDFTDAELGEMVAQDVDQIVGAWREHAADRITMAFTPNVASAESLRDAFLAADVKAELVTGKTPPAERAAVHERLMAGVTRVRVDVMVGTEGYDAPPVSCILMARPTKSWALYAQIAGRALRPAPGKTDALILDVVGASRHHRLSQRLPDLVPSSEYDESDVLKRCPACGRVKEPKVDDVFAAGSLCGEELCTCTPEETEKAERDPDGGRRKLIGPARYEDVDLIGGTNPEWNWLCTRGGVPFLAVEDVQFGALGELRSVAERVAPPPGCRAGGKVYVALYPEHNNMWSAGWSTADGKLYGEWIFRFAARAHVTRLAEAWAEAHGAPARRDQPFRVARVRASDKQVAYARRLGIVDPEGYTRGGLSDQIEIVVASRRLDVRP